MRNYYIKTNVNVKKFCIHTLCVRNTYPADDRTILYMCDLNALGGFNFFFTEGGRLGPGYPIQII